MKVLLRTNDLVLISAVEALLTGAQIEYQIADGYTSVIEGSIGAIPRRVLVAAGSIESARKLMTDAGLGHALATA